ncbi:MAG: ATP-binding protein [Terracidiphilus sp.]|jgi:signal transduction histidine kinase
MTEHCKTITPDELAQFDLFKDDSHEALQWLAERFEVRCIEAGEQYLKSGQPAREFIFLLEGELHFQSDGNRYGEAFVLLPGSAGGVLPFSRMTVYGGTGVAVKWSRFLWMDSSNLRELVYRAPCLAEKLVYRMIDRVRDTEQRSERANKMLALGKLSAGLAHELNNPASAMVRSSARLRELLALRRQHAIALRGEVATPEAQRILLNVSEAVADAARKPRQLDDLERADRADQMAQWLEAHQLPGEVASALSEAGIEAAQIAPLLTLVSREALTHSIHILACDFEEGNLTREIEEASHRIAALIKAVKSYSYMDRIPTADVDVEEGIDVTLRMFQHQLKHDIQVKRLFDGNLPKIKANGGELNQIWTNLIDNAIDAMCDAPTKILEIRTCKEATNVLVEIADSGSGIPPEAHGRIFDAFFTTKPVGKGTGLGLDIVYRIVRNHHGTISFKSSPGRTVFQVRLPLTAPVLPASAQEPDAA